jgi:hypothetical protein
LALAIVGVAILTAVPTYAQGFAPSNRYPTPALSPWFNLYNKQGGPVDNYNMYVRPDMQLRNTLQTQQLDIQRQSAGTSRLGEPVSQLEANRATIQPAGAPAGFLNHGRFFGVTSTIGTGIGGPTSRGHAAAGGRGAWSLPSANANSGGAVGR